ncbi:hypothetical protein GCM10023322_55350 [Rugosimonospora acidiphila]|uniref:Uncharacterized protein n=1 Tax=Rugosimonospora acidiphila TaxID=556531 RepID=A0ABP9SAB5_9ACTN
MVRAAFRAEAAGLTRGGLRDLTERHLADRLTEFVDGGHEACLEQTHAYPTFAG